MKTRERVNPLPHLVKTLPPGPPVCPHILGRWLTRTRRSTRTYRDGNPRPDRHRGGPLVTTGDPCTLPAGHDGDHAAAGGRTWT